MNKSLASWLDEVFGNRDGKLDFKDLPNGAPGIVLLIVDILMLVAEYRVFSAGYTLTQNTLLAIGFVAVSSVPFYLGQLAWLYNKANWQQQVLAIGMILMGLSVSAYYGFTDYILSTVSSVANITIVDSVGNLYATAVYSTVALVLGGLLYGFFDDEIANKIKENRMMGRAKVVEREMDIKAKLLDKYSKVKEKEDVLRKQYGDAEMDRINQQFVPVRDVPQTTTVYAQNIPVEQVRDNHKVNP